MAAMLEKSERRNICVRPALRCAAFQKRYEDQARVVRHRAPTFECPVVAVVAVVVVEMLKFPFRLSCLVLLVSVVAVPPAEALKSKPAPHSTKSAKPAIPGLRNWGLDNSEFASHIE